MKLPIYIVDAFTDAPFKGNPAAVCLLTTTIDEALMQNIAAEMNLSETAFLFKNGDGYNLRWFTPTDEVDLCGHATLASAFVLWNFVPDPVGDESSDRIEFYTRSGTLVANKNDSGIVLDFPVIESAPCEATAELFDSIKAEPVSVHKTKWNYLIELASEDEVINLKPDFGKMIKLPMCGMIVTAKSNSGSEFDFISRFFAPHKGINEDPVTGSAHCALAYYWNKRLGKNKFNAYQASKRGGVVGVELIGDRVMLSGKAVIVTEGTINV